MRDLIDRAAAQTELQFAARRYTVAHEAHGEGRVVWSENLISVTDAMNALRNVPAAEHEPKEIGYKECASAMLKMWIDEVLKDSEYNHIMDRLNAYWKERNENEQST